MARYTKAYSDWIVRSREVGRLIRLAKASVRRRAIDDANSLYRASVVLLCSHMEGYVEDLAEVALERVFARSYKKSGLELRFRYYLSRDVLDALRDTRDPDKIARTVVRLFARDSDIWANDGPYSVEPDTDRFVSGFSSPSFRKIKSFVRRFGYDAYSLDIGRLLGANHSACTNMIDHIVEQRNLFAHGREGEVGTPADVESMLRIVSEFFRATDSVVGNWFRQIGCSIR